jgi:hypothetical protein
MLNREGSAILGHPVKSRVMTAYNGAALWLTRQTGFAIFNP